MIRYIRWRLADMCRHLLVLIRRWYPWWKLRRRARAEPMTP